MAVKPRDPCVSMWGEKLGWKEVADWPPSKKFWENEPPGYLCWPKHELSLDPASITRTNENLKRQCQKVMLEAYKNGNRIVYADELFTVLSELKLKDEVIALLSKGSAMHASIWYALQMPKGIQGESVPGHAFNSPVHLFLAKDSDKRNRDRFAAIGGVDPEQIYSIVSGLKIHNLETANGIKPISEQLYINKRLGSLTVVGV